MNLLLSFSEYCEISGVMKERNNNNAYDLSNNNDLSPKLDMNVLRMKAMFLTGQGQIDAVTYLINQCNSKMLKELMDYFDKDAPIQKLILKKLDELDRKDNEKTEAIEFNKDNDQCGIYDILIEEMKAKGYERDSEYYNYIHMDRRIFAKFRQPGAEISRENALWLTVGFELNYLEGQEFLGKLGYAFRQTDARERLIAQIMRTRKYTFSQMQEILFCFSFKIFGESK